MTKEEALHMRAALSAAAQYLSDNDSIRYAFLFPQWKVGVHYTTNFKCLYNQKLYKVMQTHTSKDTFNPEESLGILFEEMQLEENSGE